VLVLRVTANKHTVTVSEVCEAHWLGEEDSLFYEGIFPSLLLQNDVEKVVVVILDKEHHPVERFVFEITQPPLLSIR